MATEDTAAVEEQVEETAEETKPTVEHPPYLVCSTRLSPVNRIARRAAPGKSRRKLYVAGRRLVPKRSSSMPLTDEEFEVYQGQLADLVASGLVVVKQHAGGGDYVEVEGLVPSAPTPAPQEGVAPEDAEEPTDQDSVEETEASEGADGDTPEDIEDPEATWTREELEAMKKDELIGLCEDNELSTEGKKAELVDRLLGEE